MEKKVDVAIIGAGSAGLFAASEIMKVTKNFIIINSGQYGTTCARVGCMPSKVLINIANDFHRRLKLDAAGIKGTERLSVDIPDIMRHVRRLRDGFVGGILKGLSGNKDYNIHGFAKFIEPGVLEVDGNIIRAKSVIIATGSSPVVPGPWKELGDKIITTDDLFELEDLPASIGVIGLGAIGIELGQAMSRLGVDVVGLDMEEAIAGITDPKILEHAKELINNEFPLWLGQKADIKEENGKINIISGKQNKIVDKALICMGRRPNLSGLGLEDIGAPLDDRGMPDFDPNTMKVNGMPIYICGDVTAERALLHEAADEGRIAGYNAVRNDEHKFKRRAPLAICFSDPNIAKSGASFSALSDENPIIGEVNYKTQGRSKAILKNEGLMRIYACPDTGKLLGSEMIAPGGEHMAHMLSWSIQNQMDVFDILQMPFYHPVVEEGMHSALKMIAKEIGGSRNDFEISLCTDNCLDILC